MNIAASTRCSSPECGIGYSISLSRLAYKRNPMSVIIIIREAFHINDHATRFMQNYGSLSRVPCAQTTEIAISNIQCVQTKSCFLFFIFPLYLFPQNRAICRNNLCNNQFQLYQRGQKEEMATMEPPIWSTEFKNTQFQIANYNNPEIYALRIY